MVGGGVPHEGRPNHGRKAPGLSQTDLMPPKPTIKTRRVAVLIADGFELSVLSAVCTALKAEGATTWLIAPRRGPVFPTGADRTAGTGGVMADHHLEGQRSTAFDAIFVCPGAASILTLREVRQIFFPHLFPPSLIATQNGRAVHWVREAFGHLKPIGALDDAVTFLKEAAALPGVTLAIDPQSSRVVTSYGVVTAWKSPVRVLQSLEIEPSESSFSSAFAHEISKHRCWQREMDGLSNKLAY